MKRNGFRPSQSLRLKLITVNTLLLSTAILIISSLFFINARSILKERILSDLTALVESKADRISTLVELNYEQVSLIASRRLLRRNLEEIQADPQGALDKAYEMAEILKEAAESVKFIDSMDIMNMDGVIVDRKSVM